MIRDRNRNRAAATGTSETLLRTSYPARNCKATVDNHKMRGTS